MSLIYRWLFNLKLLIKHLKFRHVNEKQSEGHGAEQLTTTTCSVAILKPYHHPLNLVLGS